MKKILNINIMEYLSLFLVLSFIVLHNIYLVFLGITLALYIIKKSYINGTISKLNDGIFNYKKIRIDISKKRNSMNLDLKNNDLNISLVEKVEESGIIPSLSKDDSDIAA